MFYKVEEEKIQRHCQGTCCSSFRKWYLVFFGMIKQMCSICAYARFTCQKLQQTIKNQVRVELSIYLSVCPSACLSVCLSICLSACLSVGSHTLSVLWYNGVFLPKCNTWHHQKFKPKVCLEQRPVSIISVWSREVLRSSTLGLKSIWYCSCTFLLTSLRILEVAPGRWRKKSRRSSN